MSQSPMADARNPAPGNGVGTVPDRAERDLRRTSIHPDNWYPLARSKDLKRGRALAVRFAGTPIVLVRPKDDEPYALENRCAHRQVPLSAGMVRADRIVCGYHGWEFNRAGRVAKVPCLVKGGPAPPRGVTCFPCRDAYGHIWVFPGDAELAESKPLPDIPYWGRKDYFTMYFWHELPCHYSFMYENSMDMTHMLLHRRTMGRVSVELLSHSAGEDWVQAEYRVVASEKQDRGLDEGTISGREKADTDFEVITLRTDYPYQSMQIARPGKDPKTKHFWACVPVDAEQRRHISMGIFSIKKPPLGLIYLAYPFMKWWTERVFAEDRWALIEEQKAWDEFGADRNNEVLPLILELRRVLLDHGVPIENLRDGCSNRGQ